MLKLRDDFYQKQLPTAVDTLLIVAVSNASERYGRDIKTPLNAVHGVPEVWLISMERKTLSIIEPQSAIDTSTSKRPMRWV